MSLPLSLSSRLIYLQKPMQNPFHRRVSGKWKAPQHRPGAAVSLPSHRLTALLPGLLGVDATPVDPKEADAPSEGQLVGSHFTQGSLSCMASG